LFSKSYTRQIYNNKLEKTSLTFQKNNNNNNNNNNTKKKKEKKKVIRRYDLRKSRSACTLDAVQPW